MVGPDVRRVINDDSNLVHAKCNVQVLDVALGAIFYRNNFLKVFSLRVQDLGHQLRIVVGAVCVHMQLVHLVEVLQELKHART